MQDTTSSDLAHALQSSVAFYCGFDPTAPALHAGNLVALVAMTHLRAAGHRPIAVVGGATGRVGDPSGRKAERDPLAEEAVRTNLQGIASNIRTVFRNADAVLGTKGQEPSVLDNMDWYQQVNFIDFLRDVGKHVRLQQMLKRESVSTRLASEAGLSFAEFSYQLLQAYDFLHLHENFDCMLQVLSNEMS